MPKACCCLGEVPFVCQGHPSNFKVIRLRKIMDFDSNLAFPDSNSSLNFTNGYEMMHKAWSSIEDEAYFFKVISQISRSYWRKKHWYLPKLGFLDCNSSLKSHMANKSCIKPEATQKMCPIVFQCLLSNFYVTQDKKRRQFLPELSNSGQ